MNFMDQPNWYAVARIDTGEVVYVGPSLYFCAEALEPGCCYVAGFSRDQVRESIQAEIRRFRTKREAA